MRTLITSDLGHAGNMMIGLVVFACPIIESEQLTGFTEFEARTARMKFRHVAITEIAQEIRFYGASCDKSPVGGARPRRRNGKKFLIDLGIVETGHRAAIETERPRSEHEVGALQAAVAHHGGGRQFRQLYKHLFHVVTRRKKGHA